MNHSDESSQSKEARKNRATKPRTFPSSRVVKTWNFPRRLMDATEGNIPTEHRTKRHDWDNGIDNKALIIGALCIQRLLYWSGHWTCEL